MGVPVVDEEEEILFVVLFYPWYGRTVYFVGVHLLRSESRSSHGIHVPLEAAGEILLLMVEGADAAGGVALPG